MKTLVAGSMVMIVASLYGLDRGSFVSEKEDVRRLAVERIRSAPMDYEKVMVAAEKRVRILHEEFGSGGEVNSSALEEDLRLLRGACQKMQRTATVGKAPVEDPEARTLVEKKWVRYQAEIRLLRDQVSEKTSPSREVKGGEGPGGEGPPPSESRVYWETIGAFVELRERTILDLLYNTPPGERGLNEALLRDEMALLKACEITPKKTRGASVRVVVPQEHGLKADPDVQTFYRSLDLVPDAQPIRSGGFFVPVGARTVTLRENKAKMVFRPRRGKGVAYLGQSETEIQYGYVAVPPDTAYYFENIGSEPLELEFVGLKP
jgi:mannose-6-phosphate isomerase-like protein (cupin superfamily)